MKIGLSTFVFTFIFSTMLFAQSTYQEAIELGDAAFKTENYRAAINYYFAAEAFDPTKKSITKEKVDTVFDRIERLKNEAENAKQEAIRQKQQADIEKQRATEEKFKAQASNRKSLKLIKALNFYDDKFALIPGNIYFEFIGPDGETKFSNKYTDATPFNKYGFARVVKQELDTTINDYVKREYLIDTLGNEYRVTYTLEELNDDIEAVDFSYQRTDSFPTELFQYPQIKILIFSRNFALREKNWETLPEDIHRLSNLEYLSIKQHQLKYLPKNIGKLTKLKELRIGHIEDLPQSFGQLSALEVLKIKNYRGTTLNPVICQLPNLKYLEFINGKFQFLPKEINQLKNLESLYIEFVSLKELHPNLFKLPKLKSLSIQRTSQGDRTLEIPKAIGQLQQLEALNLTFNGIKELPKEIGQLKNLKTLNLGINDIKELPEEIGQLKNLEKLYLGGGYTIPGNPISSLPSSFSQLSNLKSIDIGYTHLADLPAVIFDLPNLEFLSMPNLISAATPLPKTSWDKFSNLSEIYLGAYHDEIPVDYMRYIKKGLPYSIVNYEYYGF